MELIVENQSACFKFLTGKKISDTFPVGGTIGLVKLKLKNPKSPHLCELKIGDKIILAEKFIVNPFMLEEGAACYFNNYELEFKAGDVFEFSQSDDNVSEIEIWLTSVIKQSAIAVEEYNRLLRYVSYLQEKLADVHWSYNPYEKWCNVNDTNKI